MRRWTPVVLVGALLIPASTVNAQQRVARGHAAAPPVYIGDQFRTGMQHPRTLNLWASDGLGNLRWRWWGRPVATATGVISTHAYGKYSYLPTRVRASRRRMCGGRLVYTRLRYVDLQGRWRAARFMRSTCGLSA